MLCANINLWK